MSLTRPNPLDPLASSNGKSQTTIVDDIEDAIDARTSADLVTTDQFSDLLEILVNDTESLTGWHAHGQDLTDGDPGPSLNAIHSQGSNSVQAYLLVPSGAAAADLYVNLTEIGYASGLTTHGGQFVLVDIYVSQQTGWSNFHSVYINMGVFISSAPDVGGTVISAPYSTNAALSMPLNTWFTAAIPVGAMTNIKCIGVHHVDTFGSSTRKVRYQLDNIRLSGESPISQAYYSDDTVGVIVPPSYVSAVTQPIITPTATKALLDLRPSRAVHSGLDGRRSIREWGGVDETGTVDMTSAMQGILDSLSPGQTLTFPSTAVVRIDGELFINVANIELDLQGASIIQSVRGTIEVIHVSQPDFTFRNFRIFGWRPLTYNGSLMTTYAGAPATVGTTKTLSTQNDEARINPQGEGTDQSYARDYLWRNRFDFVLSDTAQVASDCVIAVKDDVGNVLASSTVTLTATPTTYTLYLTPRNPLLRLVGTVKKALATANVITITTYTDYGSAIYSSTYESNKGIVVGSGADRCLIEDGWIEGVSGTALSIATNTKELGRQGVTIRRYGARCPGMSALDVNSGRGHRIIDLVGIFCAREGIDMEPETLTHSVEDVSYENIWIWKPKIDGFVSSGWSRARNVNINGMTIYMDGAYAGFVVGGVTNSYWTNLRFYRTDAASLIDAGALSSGVGTTFMGEDCTWDGVVIDGNISIPNGSGNTNDENGVAHTTGGLTLRNVTFPKPVARGYILVQSAGVHLENITAHKSTLTTLDTARGFGSIELAPDTTYHNVDLVTLRTQLPNSFPGIAIGQPWFPSGLDLKSEGLSKAAYLSGGASKGNNLRGLAAGMGAGNTAMTVTFPARSHPNFTGTSAATAITRAGANLPLGTYFWRVVARNRRGGPILPTSASTEITRTLTGTQNAMQFEMAGTYDLASGFFIAGATVYRGTSSGVYSTRFDIVPTADIAGWSVAGASNNHTGWTDAGDTIVSYNTTDGPLAGMQYHGYTFPYAKQTGSWTSAAGANQWQNETGWEPDTSYGVFLSTNWLTGWRIAAKRRGGFDIEFDTPAPGNRQVITEVAAASLADTVGRTLYTTPSFTPPANCVLAVGVTSAVGSGSALAPTVTDSTVGTWTPRGVAQVYNTNVNESSAFTSAVGASPVAMTISADFGAITQTGCLIQVYAITNAGAILQVAQNHSTAGGSPTASFATVPGSSSVCLGFVGGLATWTPNGTWVKDKADAFASPTTTQDAFSSTTPVQSIAPTAGSGGWGVTLLEIGPDASAVGTVDWMIVR